MSNALYAKAKEKFLSASINLTSDTIKVLLVDTDDYAVNTSTHEFLSDVPLAARTGTAIRGTLRSLPSSAW